MIHNLREICQRYHICGYSYLKRLITEKKLRATKTGSHSQFEVTTDEMRRFIMTHYPASRFLLDYKD